MKSFYLPALILILFTLLETLCCTYLLENGKNIELISILYFVSGIILGVFPMIEFKYISNFSQQKLHLFSRINKIILWSFFVFIAGYFIFFSHAIMETIIIDYKVSDMLPQIKIMCQRLINGEKIYAPIQNIWDGKNPPYLPLMWLPFVPAELLQIDL